MPEDLIKPSCDRKVRGYSVQKNTYGLLPGPEGTCPGATVGAGGCRDITGNGRPACYVYKIMRIYSGVRRILEHNTALLKGADMATMADLLGSEFTRFQADTLARNGKGMLRYRLHWAGDLFSMDYARALRTAVDAHPDVFFWTYTRSFDYMGPLLGAPNLRLYVSADMCNLKEAMAAHRAAGGKASMCYMGDSAPALPGLRFTACPVDKGSMQLEGACFKCGMCLKGIPVFFETKRG